jgi:hypothetical protein
LNPADYTTVATCTPTVLNTPLVLTVAVSGPSVGGLVENVTVSDVAPPLVTVSMSPLLKVTLLQATVGLRPRPLIVTVLKLPAWLAVLDVTTGEAVSA